MADIVCHRCNKIIDDKYGIGASIRCDDTCGKLIHYNCTQDEDFHFSNIFDGSKQFYCVNCTVSVNLKDVNLPEQTYDSSLSKESESSSSSSSSIVVEKECPDGKSESTSKPDDIAQFARQFNSLRSFISRYQYSLEKLATIIVECKKVNTTHNMLWEVCNKVLPTSKIETMQFQDTEMENCIINIERVQLHIKQEIRNLRIKIKKAACKLADLKTEFSFLNKLKQEKTDKVKE